MVRVLYFASLRERAGRGEEQVDLPPGVATVAALAAWLRARDPAGAAAFADPALIRAAVNQDFAGPDAPRGRRGRGGVLPARHRRMTPTVRVGEAGFDVGAELAALTAGQTGIGGIGSFLGIVRDDPAHPLESLTLEHYPGMTERAMTAIAAEASSRWSLLGCTVLHRVGRLVPGDPIVLVLAAAPHRHAALDATAFLIDWLKTRAPFWKSERFADGARRWVEARSTDDTAAARW